MRIESIAVYTADLTYTGKAMPLREEDRIRCLPVQWWW